MPSWTQSSFSRCLEAAALALVLAGALSARADTAVTAIVDTEDAIFFQPSNAPDVVWFMPRTRTSLTPVEEAPGFWRAAVELRELELAAPLEALNPDWEGATLAPFIVRPTSECILQRDPSMRFVQQEVRALGRDVSAGVAVAMCQFTFRLPRPEDPQIIAALQAAAASGHLVGYELSLPLRSELTVPWTTLHEAVARELPATTTFTPARAAQAVDDALAGEALAALTALTTADELAALRAQLVSRLFAGSNTRKRLVTVPPPGEVTYHVDVRTYHL